MPSSDRGIIKWAPFESVTSTKKMINDILKEKNKIKSPVLSEEQIKTIENTLIIAYYEQNEVEISYYQSGAIKKLISNIKKIDSINHKIYFNELTILFEQIIGINTI